MNIFLGISAADGIGIGPAFLIPEPVIRIIPQDKVTSSEIKDGWLRFEKAVNKVTNEISGNLAELPKENKSNSIQREIFETYILMLRDMIFIKEVKNDFEKNLQSIEYIVNKKAQEYAERLRSSGIEYLAERAQDITDIFGRVIDEMLGIHPFDISQIPDGSVVIASTLNPADTIFLAKKKIAALILTEGGVSSHVVILARNYGIPAVTGLEKEDLRLKVSNNQTIIADAFSGKIFISPEEEILKEYRFKIIQNESETEELKKYFNKPALTKDGIEFKLYANIGTPEEAETAFSEGAAGIGLFRTEFLYMSNSSSFGNFVHSFSEDDQVAAYKKVLQIMKGKPVTIRTLDTGGDKLINASDIPNIKEKNPLMGMRAVRLSLAYPELFKTQLRALFRASIYGNLRIMFPLITSIQQVKDCLEIIESVKKELISENIDFKDNVPIGIMIETAAAAVISDQLAKISNFFSIGTNDLTQYTLGIDRENSSVAGLYDEFNLAVLRLIALTFDNAKKYGISIEVCGEMAGRTESILVLGGLGIRELSMSPKLISKTKKLLSKFTIAELEAEAEKKFSCI